MSSDSLLSLKIVHRVGVLTLDVAFELTQPWTVLFGPSGSGKTTVMRAIAGFVKPNTGRISRGESVLMDRQTGVFVPAHLRPVRSAGQTARLFPHMTVKENLLFGVGAASSSGSGEIADEVIAMFRLQGFTERMPKELSGGERERVSAARAVISAATFSGPERACLLLDEPFAGLDSAVRDQLLLELRAWVAQREIPVLSVTHDVGEAFQLGAEVIKIAAGKIVAQGPVGEVLAGERRRLMEQLGQL
ncbi:ATP-binding cassette domain-containing protein [Granulicella sp. dw_53]|uniref:ATP-binding cassette domain-containing protein n=1 Tax=Granulicella sp. dw_53 TaxID=2719792 RepID=UPI001BD4C99F|nr:ATP-binding cassette domain-containing protein [Granulicella sp. dw_53]